MKSGITYNQGSLVLVLFLFTDLSATKNRPALVVSPDWFNKTYEDIVLVAVTSSYSISKEKNEVTLSQRDISSGVIPKDSIIKITKLFTCHRDVVVKEIAKVKIEKVTEVLLRLRIFFNE